jgi:hypothetical protein
MKRQTGAGVIKRNRKKVWAEKKLGGKFARLILYANSRHFYEEPKSAPLPNVFETIRWLFRKKPLNYFPKRETKKTFQVKLKNKMSLSWHYVVIVWDRNRYYGQCRRISIWKRRSWVRIPPGSDFSNFFIYSSIYLDSLSIWVK